MESKGRAIYDKQESIKQREMKRKVINRLKTSVKFEGYKCGLITETIRELSVVRHRWRAYDDIRKNLSLA